MLSKSCMPIGYFIIVLLLSLQTYDILCRKTIIRYVLSCPSSLPTKLPLLAPSSPWRGCSRTPFGRRNWCSGFEEIRPIVSLGFCCSSVSNSYFSLQITITLLSSKFNFEDTSFNLPFKFPTSYSSQRDSAEY